MKWQLLLFTVLFITFTSLAVFYANKKLVLYQKTTVEKIIDTSTVYHNGEVSRTYQDNYASIGGAIGFAILAAASLLAFSNSIRNNKN